MAVSTLTSGQQPEVIMDNKTCGTSGIRTPRRRWNWQHTKSPTFRAVSACVVTTWRGKLNSYSNEQKNRGERWSRTTEGRNESQSKVTAYTTGARHSHAASSRRGAGKHSLQDEKKRVGARRQWLLTSLRFNYISNSIRRRAMAYSFEGFTNAGMSFPLAICLSR